MSGELTVAVLSFFKIAQKQEAMRSIGPCPDVRAASALSDLSIDDVDGSLQFASLLSSGLSTDLDRKRDGIHQVMNELPILLPRLLLELSSALERLQCLIESIQPAKAAAELTMTVGQVRGHLAGDT